MPANEPIEFDAHAEISGLAELQPTARYYRWGRLLVIVSDNDQFEQGGDLWRHVSFSTKVLLPDWEEIKAVRDQFFPVEAEVFQVLPPKDRYVNNMRYCLHLWWNKSRRMLPDLMTLAVGIPGEPTDLPRRRIR